jgi:hypothetical protein
MVMILDADQERAHIEDRLATASRREDPFPHVWVENVLSPRLYTALKDAWPETELFPPEERDNRRDLVPRPPGTSPADSRASTYDALPEQQRALWDYFVLGVNRAIVGPWLQRLFEPEIGARTALIADLWKQGRVTKDYYEPPHRPKMNVGRLMMRAKGFRLRPHVDALPYLVTVLYYFPEDGQRTELGTTLYRTPRALSDEELADTGKTVYFDRSGLTATAEFHAPFRANCLLAFANTPRSAHGMEITEAGPWRRAYQSHLSIKSDAHHL